MGQIIIIETRECPGCGEIFMEAIPGQQFCPDCENEDYIYSWSN